MRATRRKLLLLAGACALPLRAAAQGKNRPVGLLWIDSAKPSPYIATLARALKAKGYETGRDVRFEERIVDGYAALDGAAVDLVRAKSEVILAFGSTATAAAAKATKRIPVVMIAGADPVARGFAASLSRPGGNVTGMHTIVPDLTPKRLELIAQLVPPGTRIGILAAADSAAIDDYRKGVERGARALNVPVEVVDVHSPRDLDDALARLQRAKVGGLLVGGSTMLMSQRARIIDWAARTKVAGIYSNTVFEDAGGLMVYAANVNRSFERAADYVARVLSGARAGDLPIEQTSSVELVVNLKTARALGIQIPQAILQRVDRVIQ